MQQQDDFHTSLLKYGIDLGFILSGFFGAVILSLRNKKKTVGKTISCIVAGTLCANYLTPLILNIAPKSVQENGKYACAFMMGYIGLKGLESMVDVFTDYMKSKKKLIP